MNVRPKAPGVKIISKASTAVLSGRVPDRVRAMPGTPTTLADRLRQALALRSMSGLELGRRAGLKSTGHVSQMLTGHAGKRPSGETLDRLARALDVPVGWLARGEGEATDGYRPARAARQAVLLGNLPQWPKLREATLKLDPAVKPWALDRIAGWPVVVASHPTPLQLAKFAHTVEEFETEPE